MDRGSREAGAGGSRRAKDEYIYSWKGREQRVVDKEVRVVQSVLSNLEYHMMQWRLPPPDMIFTKLVHLHSSWGRTYCNYRTNLSPRTDRSNLIIEQIVPVGVYVIIAPYMGSLISRYVRSFTSRQILVLSIHISSFIKPDQHDALNLHVAM